MLIKIKEAKKFRFNFYLPLSAVKWRFVYDCIEKGSRHKYDDEENSNAEAEEKQTAEWPAVPPAELKKMGKQIYEVLKEFKREHGSFELVDVKGNDGTTVKIII